MAASPGNTLLAARSLDQALTAGDRALAVRAAQMLEGSSAAVPPARLTLMTEAVRTEDWKEANRHIDALAEDKVFAMLAPVLRAWIMFETRPSEALKMLSSGAEVAAPGSYVAEHRALMLLALGHEKQGLAELAQLTQVEGGRAQRLRIAAAALLADQGDRGEAAKLLEGQDPPMIAARALLAARKPIPGAIDDAREGIAEFLVRLAADIAGQSAPEAALTYARLATFLAPDNSETWLVTSDLLAASDEHQAALAALEPIAADDPFAAAARDGRVRLLAASGEREAALARAETQVRNAGATAAEWTRLGDLYATAERYDESAGAYGRALALAQSGQGERALWTLHLLRGSALEQGGRWPEAKAALEAAYKLAPEEPLVLNYLGYAQLERRENLVEAERLVREASRLRPDDSAITDSLGWALYLNGRLPQAIELLERAAAGEPGDPAIHEHLGDAYYSAGRRIEARFAWQAALVAAEDKDATRIREKIETGLTPQLASP